MLGWCPGEVLGHDPVLLQLGAQDVVLLLELVALLAEELGVHRDALRVLQTVGHARVRVPQLRDVVARLRQDPTFTLESGNNK